MREPSVKKIVGVPLMPYVFAIAKFLSMAEFQGTELRMKEVATHDFNPDSSPC